MPFEAAILETEAAPIFQRIAPEVNHLRQLGLSCAAIARHLGVNDKTVAKAVRRLLEACET
jgi:transposase-like protein